MAKERTWALGRRLTRGLGLGLAGLVLWGSVAPAWGAPTVAQMLGYRPAQEGVNYSTPTGDAVNGCTVELINGQTKGSSGWLLKDAGKQPLRLFFDSNGDNKIDIWAYYKDGVEVYREIDSTHSNKPPNQFRWVNSGGMKWGVAGPDGKIASWKAISPEEVSQELLQAVAKKDFSKVEALMITEAEMKELNLPADMVTKIREQHKAAPARFQETVSKLPDLNPAKVTWLHLETKAPRCLPADQTGTRYDLIKHSSGTVLFDAGGKNEWLQTGEMIQVGLAWRLVSAPTLGSGVEESDDGSKTTGGIKVPSDNPQLLKLIQDLTDLDKKQPAATAAADVGLVRHHLQRADVLEKIIALVKPEEREPWIRQVADSLSTAAQASPKGETAAMTRLLSLENQLASKMAGSNLAAYVTFREMQADYAFKIAEEKDFTKVQQAWVDRLSKFIQTYPKAEDTADALLQAGNACEFLDKETEAKNWYGQLKRNFPSTPQAAKAEGAIVRLDSDGKTFQLAGPTLQDPNQVFDIASLQGKIVIVYYWAAWNGQSVGDFAKLKLLLETYGKKGVELVCINLDNNMEDARSFLARSPAPGTHLYQAGGLESKLATSYGVMMLPNAFVIDSKGKMANRKIQINSLEDEVKKQLLK